MAVRSSPRSRPISVLQPASSLATEKPVPCGSSNTSSRSCDTSIPPKHALSSSRPFLADAGSGPGNCAGMEETTGAPSSFAALSPRRLRASSRDGGGVVNRPPSPLTMLLSRHTRRRELIGIIALASFAARSESSAAQTTPKTIRLAYLAPIRIPHLVEALTGGLRDLGYVEGQNLSIEYRFAGENPEHFDLLARACEARPSRNRHGGDSGHTGGGESDLKA